MRRRRVCAIGSRRVGHGAGEHGRPALAGPGRDAVRPACGGIGVDQRRGGWRVAGLGRRLGWRPAGGARPRLRGSQVGRGRPAGAQEGAPRGPAPGQQGQARDARLCRLCDRLHHLSRGQVRGPRCSNATACAGRSNSSSSASNRWPGSATCPSATPKAPAPGSTASSSSPCWPTRQSATPAPFRGYDLAPPPNP